MTRSHIAPPETAGRGGTDADALPYVVASGVTAVVGIGAAIVIHDRWAFRGHALSDLGAVGVEHAWVFNATLVLAGVLGVLGTLKLRRGAGRLVTSLGFGLLVGVGLFPAGTWLHAPVAVAFFLVETAGLVVLGIERGVRSAVLVVLACAGAGVLTGVLVPGVAVAETVWSLGFLVGFLLLLAPAWRERPSPR